MFNIKSMSAMSRLASPYSNQIYPLLYLYPLLYDVAPSVSVSKVKPKCEGAFTQPSEITSMWEDSRGSQLLILVSH